MERLITDLGTEKTGYIADENKITRMQILKSLYDQFQEWGFKIPESSKKNSRFELYKGL